MISLQHVSKSYSSSTLALNDINIIFNKKEVSAVLGASGSGKSTLLRIIAGLESPSTGQVNYISQERVGMVFQHFNLFPHMSVLDNLIYAPVRVRGMSVESAKTKAGYILNQFNIDDMKAYFPHNLSGGQKQRVAIARALMMDPSILLFDEPTSALDDTNIAEVVAIIEKIKVNMAVIVVTHNIEFAKSISDRVVYMKQARVINDIQSTDFFRMYNENGNI